MLFKNYFRANKTEERGAQENQHRLRGHERDNQ